MADLIAKHFSHFYGLHFDFFCFVGPFPQLKGQALGPFNNWCHGLILDEIAYVRMSVSNILLSFFFHSSLQSNMFKSIILCSLAITTFAFIPSTSRNAIVTPATVLLDTSIPPDGVMENIKTRIRIAQESNAAGNSFKQVVADVLAGEYDESTILEKINKDIVSAPCGTCFG